MGNCVKLKWNRKRLGMTRKAFADHVGLSEETIRRLETDETVWATMRAETADKIYAAFEPMSSWQPERPDKVVQEINDDNIDDCVTEEEVKPEPVVVCEAIIELDKLTTKDRKTLDMLEFLYEELKSVESHSDFIHTMKMISKVVSKY